MVISSTFIGLCIGALGLVISLFATYETRMTILFTTTIVFLLLEYTNKTKILPTGKFAIPAEWVNQAGNKSSLLWGSILGLGFITYQAGSIFHFYVITSILIGDLLYSIIAGAIYGLIRSVPPVFTSYRHFILNSAQNQCKNTNSLSLLRRRMLFVVYITSIMLVLSRFNIEFFLFF